MSTKTSLVANRNRLLLTALLLAHFHFTTVTLLCLSPLLRLESTYV